MCSKLDMPTEWIDYTSKRVLIFLPALSEVFLPLGGLTFYTCWRRFLCEMPSLCLWSSNLGQGE